MDNFIASRMNEDLNNPNSPYYLGQMSPSEAIERCINGNGYNTHYFGSNARSFLAQPSRDTLQILKNAKSEHEKNILYKWTIGAAATVAGLLIARKIPVIKLIPQGIGWVLGKMLGR